MTFGRSQANFWIDQPEAVAQSIMTRLRLNTGEWFANTADGTPWAAEVLGERTQATRDVVVHERVLQTVGVSELTEYFSALDPNTRDWTATMTVQTIYGPVALAVTQLPGSLPPGSVVPGPFAQLLGIAGSPTTGVIMTPADLTGTGSTNIRDFEIVSIDGGRY